MFLGNAFYIFMFRQFFAQIPEALVEAARIDGCGYLRTWWSIMLPLCQPVIALTAVFTFMFVWNDFLGPLIYLQGEQQYTLAIALNSFRNQYGGVNQVHLLMAASLVAMLPCVLLFFVAQRQFVGGLSIGAVKG
jgi:ABC-type glycerol-3-phosphate transport system permease component